MLRFQALRDNRLGQGVGKRWSFGIEFQDDMVLIPESHRLIRFREGFCGACRTLFSIDAA